MQTWVVDSSNIPLDELDGFDASLLHRTPAIERFLDKDNQETLAIVGPKGFGKTLLILAKRAQLSHDGAITLPRNASVDKPMGDAPTLAAAQIEHIMAHRAFWKNIWLMAFMVCAAKEHKNHLQTIEQLRCSEVISCLKEAITNTPSYFLKRFLRILPAQYYALVEDIDEIEPLFRNIHSPTYIFLDNVDEMFDIHLQNGDDFRNPSHGIRRNQFWHSAQIGAFEAARHLSRINSHVRIYCSIRKEALEEGLRHDAQALQTRGACLILEYSALDLKTILIKNIEAEKTSLLVSPKEKDHFRRWVGKSAATLEHDVTGDTEELPDYIIRHTLRRPRDVVFIGRAISQLSLADRKSAKIKNAVNEAAAGIARDYLVECRPHLSGFDSEILFDLLETNVLDRSDIKSITERYRALYAGKYHGAENDAEHVFRTLYRIGLLGYVRRSTYDSNYIQTFRSPGGPVIVEDEKLPQSDYYLVHPILSDLIRAKFRLDYARNRNRMNIIEPDRIWRMDTDGHFVIHGDIVGYSKVMNTAGIAELSQHLARLARDVGAIVRGQEFTAGDSFLLVDQNPKKLFSAAHELLKGLLDLEPALDISFGADYGVITHRKDTQDGTPRWHGMPLQISERIRKSAEPGEIIFTNELVQRLAQLKFEIEDATHIGTINVAKDRSEPEFRDVWRYSIKEQGIPPCFKPMKVKPKNKTKRFGDPES